MIAGAELREAAVGAVGAAVVVGGVADRAVAADRERVAADPEEAVRVADEAVPTAGAATASARVAI